jgi:hypothetical protein
MWNAGSALDCRAVIPFSRTTAMTSPTGVTRGDAERHDADREVTGGSTTQQDAQPLAADRADSSPVPEGTGAPTIEIPSPERASGHMGAGPLGPAPRT